MLKGEKILLGATAATAAVAVVMLLSGPAQAPRGAGSKPGVPALANVEAIVRQNTLTASQRYCLGLLAENATGDPFYGGTAVISQEDDNASGSIVYSGFIKAGPRLLAVINGIEYAVGDALADGDYTVQAIDRNFVQLERTDSSTGRNFTKRVPLVEDDADKIRIRVVKKR